MKKSMHPKRPLLTTKTNIQFIKNIYTQIHKQEVLLIVGISESARIPQLFHLFLIYYSSHHREDIEFEDSFLVTSFRFLIKQYLCMKHKETAWKCHSNSHFRCYYFTGSVSHIQIILDSCYLVSLHTAFLWQNSHVPCGHQLEVSKQSRTS